MEAQKLIGIIKEMEEAVMVLRGADFNLAVLLQGMRSYVKETAETNSTVDEAGVYKSLAEAYYKTKRAQDAVADAYYKIESNLAE